MFGNQEAHVIVAPDVGHVIDLPQPRFLVPRDDRVALGCCHAIEMHHGG